MRSCHPRCAFENPAAQHGSREGRSYQSHRRVHTSADNGANVVAARAGGRYRRIRRESAHAVQAQRRPPFVSPTAIAPSPTASVRHRAATTGRPGATSSRSAMAQPPGKSATRAAFSGRTARSSPSTTSPTTRRTMSDSSQRRCGLHADCGAALFGLPRRDSSRRSSLAGRSLFTGGEFPGFLAPSIETSLDAAA